MKEKSSEMNKAIEVIKQHTNEKKNRKKHYARSLDFNKRKTTDQKRTDTKNRKIRFQTKNEIYRNPIVPILQQPENSNNKRHRNKHTIKIRTLLGITKSQTHPATYTRRRRERVGESKKAGQLEKVNNGDEVCFVSPVVITVKKINR